MVQSARSDRVLGSERQFGRIVCNANSTFTTEAQRGKAASFQRSAFSGQGREHDRRMGQGGTRIFARRKETKS
jgi:hypothetical protein